MKDIERIYDKMFENNFCDITLEITRRCNLTCKHCMRGDAQNISMTKPIIDKFFSQTTYINTLLITGGEPFIDEEIFDYMIDAIIKYDIAIIGMQILSNGTIQSEKIVKSINKLLKHFSKRKSMIRGERFYFFLGFSDDYFHLKQIPYKKIEETRQYYRNHIICPENVNVDISLMSEKEDRLGEIASAEDIYAKISRVGNAEKNNLGHCECENCYAKHRITFENYSFILCGETILVPFVKCRINILANGNWGTLFNYTFKDGDNQSIGNIMTDNGTITKKIREYNRFKCLCTCEEASYFSTSQRIATNDKDFIMYKFDEINEKNYERYKENAIQDVKKYEKLFKIREKLRAEKSDIEFEELQEKSEKMYIKDNEPTRYFLNLLRQKLNK